MTDDGNIVMVEQDYWNSMVETLRLFSDKRSLKALLEGIEARKSGKKIQGKSINDIFGNEQL